MSTRIDRLFCLLQDGQNPLVRQTAAQQIGEICEMDPNKVDTLLDRVNCYAHCFTIFNYKSYNLLFSNKWESRTAAGQVFEEILKHVAMVHHTNKNEETFLALPFEALTVQGYDIKKIINNPQHLVESNTNQTYLDVFLEHNHIHIKNDLISLLILERIGLISDNEILTLNTLKSQYIQLIENKQNNDIDIDIDIEIIKDDNLNLQKIETYLEKLKETESKENENNLKNNDKKLNKLKDEDFKLLMTLRSSLHPKNTNSNKTKNKQCVVIIFSDWYKKLVPYLLHSNWKYRHGAAIGLRSLLKTLLIIGNHNDNHNANENNNIFVEGCLMCLSVLLLDRFFDFQSDILVAPISETVAQCFSLFLKYTSNNRHFLQLFNLLIECLDIKRVKTWSWHIRYCSYLALKYILPLHYMQIIAFKNDKLIKNIISLTCNGLKDEMEDVCNMSSQVLLSVISLFDNVNINVDNMQNVIFDSLLYALNQIDEYFGSTISVLNVLNCVFNQFTELINEYVNDKKHHYVFSNIFNILLSIMNNSSICMKKQVILTLHKFIQFVINKNIINEKQIISLIETIFDKIMSEQHSDIKQSIEVLKDDNDFDEYEMYLQYAEYMNHLQSLWNYICSNLQHLILIQHNNTNSLPLQYQQMILKLFNSLQKHAILKKQSNSNDNDNDNDKKEEQRLPTSQLLEKIEQLKNSKNNKKRKRMDENENKMEPPIATKKRKLNSNKCENKKRIDIKTTNHETDFLYPSEIILWSVIDSGCILLSQLFCCHALHPLSWDIVQYLLLQFLSQRKKQKHKKKKHIIYGWRRIIGCWLLSDCYFELKKYLKNKNEIEIEMKENDKIINMINTLRNVKHNDIYQEYDELKMRRQMITYHTNNLILTFKHNDNVSNEMNKYFNNLQFDEYVHALTNKYNEWKSIEKKENKNENNNNNNKERKDCYKLLLATVLNAEYALDSHDLLLQCSMSNILITNGNIINILQLNIESVLQPLLLALKSTNKRLNLQYRAAHSLALAMKLLSDNHQTQILEKVFNSLLADCGQNTQYKARDNIRMVIQCICDLFMDENIFDKLSFIINKMKNILMDYDDCDWIAMAQIFACFISSIKSKDIKTKYLQPLIENVMICNTVFMIEDEDDVNYGICAQSRYCILQYLYQEPNVILPLIIKQVIPKLYCDDICFRLGALELIWDILYSIDNIQCVETEIKHKNINKCQRYENYSQLNVKENQKTLLMQILSYLSSLIVPLLSQMTDFNNKIRKRANQIFSIAVRLIPLEQGLNLDNDNKDRKILQQLIDPSVIDEYQCPFQYDATLRHYQQDGINWLWFLNKFHLHGILADDMGLGKTLQTLLIITASYHINTNTNTNDPLPSSLIVCPSTLVYHWLHEINKFIPNLLVPFIIDGNPRKRRGLYCKLKEENGNSKKNNYIVIMSYNTMKNDISYINANCNVWHYCVLDEGHLIKNPKAKISISVKTIASKYRLILSGTPIQNNVLDLWSLFDFLMPGFLGNESWFKKNFSSPIIASYKAKAKNNNNKQRVAALKLQRLHKQVLPFILRRLKCDVLKELPPKIIQDVEVDMSSIQKTLYKHFVNSDKFEAISSINNTMNTKNNNQSMQSLIYMRKLVVHPKLIMTKQHPLFHQILHDLQKDNLSLECIDISPKFVALKSLIEQCICDKSHRMLIFVQYRQVITLIESLLLSQYFPDLPYKTLTGKLTNAERFDVVKEFNAKNSRISLLLLTVNVGGLGLNLSSANIIIFMEHDWNPMKDLQAMDRAHRIGQTKTVHVFRIIVRNTIEWEIMNKQRFKQHIANTVISKENASLSSITTGSGSILDLFYMNNSKNNKNDNDNNDGYANGGVDALGKVHEKTKKQKALDSMLDTLGNMTTINQQYQNEYDLKNSTAKKPSKIVVGDQSGTITCFKWLKEEIHTTFQQTKDQPITALTLNDDKIVIAYGQTIETIKKKGKILSTFTLSLNEDITSLQAKGDSIWCCGEYVYNCYKNEKDSHFFMSKDIINDIILIDLGFDELCPVLACKDKAIRVLHGSELLFEIETSSNTKSLHEMPNKQIIYGLENGSIGGVLLNKESIKHGCLLNDVNEGSVNCISSYDFRKDGGRQVVIGRDNGNIDIFEWNTDKPYILASQALNESITGIDNGYVTGITDQDIVIVTYSGKIKAFHCDPARDFSAWQEAEMNILSPLKYLKQNITKTNIQQEIESYRQEITLEKNKYQEKSKELIAVNRQFHLKNSLKLLEGEGAYLLRLEIGIGIDFVAIQSCVEIVSLDIDQYFGLQTQHKNMELFDDNLWNSNKNNCFVFHSSSDNITRFTWKFRVCEGEQGVLTAFIASKRVPKTCQTCEFLIKALSLHSSIYDIAAHNVEIEKRPMNRLEMSGDWTLRTFNAWLSQCIPDVPSHTLNTNEISLSWQSIFVGDYITVTYTNASAIFEADSVTAIAILQEFLTKLAIKNNVSISNVNININTQSIIHFFHLIQPKLQFHHKIHRQHSLINALKEIEAHEQDLMCLSDEMQNILKNSDQILKDFKTSPKHLQFIKNMIWSNTQNWAKLQNATITMKNLEKLKRGLDNTDCDIILSAIRDIMR